MTWLDCGRCSLAVAMLSFLTASCFRPLPERTLEGPLPRAELGLRSTSYKVTEVAETWAIHLGETYFANYPP